MYYGCMFGWFTSTFLSRICKSITSQQIRIRMLYWFHLYMQSSHYWRTLNLPQWVFSGSLSWDKGLALWPVTPWATLSSWKMNPTENNVVLSNFTTNILLHSWRSLVHKSILSAPHLQDPTFNIYIQFHLVISDWMRFHFQSETIESMLYLEN